MLNHRKRLLQLSERVALVAALACLGVALASHFFESVLPIVRPVAIVVLLAIFYLALMIAGLTSEFSQSIGKPPTSSEDHPGLSFRELRDQFRWSPRAYKFAAVLALAAIVITAFGFGAISWTWSDPFPQSQAIGAMLYLSSILFLMLPVIASAARMPATLKDDRR